MADIKDVTTQLAELMDEFKLEEAKIAGDGWKVGFRKTRAQKTSSIVMGGMPMAEASGGDDPVYEEPAAPAKPTGTPVSSPMTGIFYSSPSPNAPSFVKEGETVTAGDVVGLIEAMKVFNEIHAPVSGTVQRVVAANGALVSPGEPLLYIG